MCRPFAVAATGVVLVAGISYAPPATAAGPEARCDFDYNPEFSPGLTLAPGSGTVTSNGATGTTSCTGTVNGAEITGPGKFGFEGSYGKGTPVSCTSGGDGEGRLLVELPTAKGTVKLTDPIRYKFGIAGGYPPGTGDWSGVRTHGVYLVLPVKGDCVASPLTTARGTGSYEITPGY